MSEEHTATKGALTKALVATVVEELQNETNFRYWTNQSATLYKNDPQKACEMTLYEVWTDFLDHLQIPLAVTLATFGINADGRTPENRTYCCKSCGGEFVITRGNDNPPLPWPNPDGWICWSCQLADQENGSDDR